MSDFGVQILPKPNSNESALVWTSEKDRLCRSLTRIIAQNRKRKDPGNSVFFYSKSYTVFTKVNYPAKSEIDQDFNIESLNIDSDHSNSEMTHKAKKTKVLLGRRKGPISSDQTFRNRIKPIREQIIKSCKEEGLKISMCIAKLASLILNDYTGDFFDKKSGSILHNISKGENPSQQQEVQLSASDGLYLMSTLEIGRDRYVNLSQYCRKRKIIMPNYNKVKKRRLEIVPETEDCFDQGIWCPLSKILKTNVKSTIECFTDIQEPPDILRVKAT